jgi:hypothetical protein
VPQKVHTYMGLDLRLKELRGTCIYELDSMVRVRIDVMSCPNVAYVSPTQYVHYVVLSRLLSDHI